MQPLDNMIISKLSDQARQNGFAKESPTSVTILVHGVLAENSAKMGLRYAIIEVSQPYSYEVNLRIYAKADQDDDQMNEALWDLYKNPVLVHARIDDGSLVCTTDDIVLATNQAG